jgi:hypothetical protein
MSIENALEELVPPFEPRPGGWDDVRRRARRTRRRYGVAAVAIAALLLVPAALGLQALFQGTPAPPAVRTVFADQFTREGFASRYPQADVSQAHGVLEVQTADGPEDLWAAPNDQGGQCWFIDWANDLPGPDGQFGFGGCYPVPVVEDIDWGASWVPSHAGMQTLWGHLNVQAARVEVDLAGGSTLHLSVVERFFLASLSRDDRVTRIRAYDNDGARVATAKPGPGK